MPKYLDGLVPIVISLTVWVLVFDQELTLGTVWAMAFATVCYQGVKAYLRIHKYKETSNG